MTCSSLCRVPFTVLLLSAQNVTLAITASVTTLVQENSHSRWSSLWGLGQLYPKARYEIRISQYIGKY
jgi:hypothetical protein